ncbi:MAG: DUF3179 domain-containing protein [Bacteroidota bacterium]
MKFKFNYVLPFICLLLIYSACGVDDGAPNPTQQTQEDWDLPLGEIFDGGPGIDGIPSLDAPNFINNTEANYLEDNDLVIALKVGEEVRAYPHRILDWHEIVNDDFGSTPVAITYCPLTGTAIGWDRNVDGNVTEFGVSGLLYNSNLMPYDRRTSSFWSQMRLDCVNGSLRGKTIQTIPLLETTWSTYKKLYPNGKILSDETGFSRDYNRYPYGDYITSRNLLFTINKEDNRLHPKDRVLGVQIDDSAIAYQFNLFAGGRGIIADEINGTELIIVGDPIENFLLAFKSRMPDGSKLTFTISDEAGILMTDNEGNKWDYFGFALEGPRQGIQLEQPINYIGYWFSWATFQHDITLK